MQLMIILDGTVVTVALPAIQRDLHFSQTGLSWVVNSYLIVFAGLLLLSGRLGDLVGGKRVFLWGLAVFTAASLLCGLATTPEWLITGRALQGLGAALASAVILGLITRLYPEPGRQARALGIFSFVSAGGASAGLIAGGVITDTLGWQWAFLINLPIGVVALAAAARLLDAGESSGRWEDTDALGALLVTAGLSLGVFAIAQISEESRSGGEPFVLGSLAVALLAAFVVRQATASRPLLALRIFRDRGTTGANIVVVLVFAAGFGFQFLNALYLQRVLGFDSMQTGLAFLPAPVVLGAVSLFLAARLTSRWGTRRVLLAGLFVLGAGLLLLGRAPVEGDYWIDVAPALAIQGLGMGLAVPAVIMRAMSGVAPNDAGLASGLNNTAQQAGAAIGLAVLATVATERSATLTGRGIEVTRALRDGYSLAFLVAAGLVFLACLVTWFVLTDSDSDSDSDSGSDTDAAAARVGTQGHDNPAATMGAGRHAESADPAASPVGAKA
ncbi:MFS transporter [Streptomyces sp. TRM66268-LWL]|uniref:MFS transporter n=2 Tax=Streptomyces polyasparticus TaxID=2767826 RepID=A0ABR7ST50_9ACTN|nr:MFS transporter [Streptomyces polyasparticus]